MELPYRQGDLRRSCIDTYLWNREYGFRPKYGSLSRLYHKLYSSLKPIATWKEPEEHTMDIAFNLEFSPDGKILASEYGAFCLRLFDPLTQKDITSITKAHKDDGKCIKFLNDRVFATCSNDWTISLWDTRNLKEKMRVLRGNSSSVRSLEYSAKNNLLVSRGVNGLIKVWDINRYSEEDTHVDNDLWYIYGLVSMKLLPDSSKLVLSTNYGLILLINNLDLETLHTDVRELRPLRYFQMEKKEFTTIPESTVQAFTRKRNRVEFITDFPRFNNATMIRSIQVHPKGWNVLSCFLSSNRMTEYICVHDIQDVAVPSDLVKQEELSSEKPNLLGHSLDVDSLYKLIRKSNRLTHFIEETCGCMSLRFNLALCYSSDGHIICSTLQNRVRLLSFSPKCDELSSIQSQPPDIRLYEIDRINIPNDSIVCSKFSPVHPLLVSSCVSGNIVWYQPRL